MVEEIATTIKSQPKKCKSCFGNWYVLADAHFKENVKKWDYPSKHYYFWKKEKAIEFINLVSKSNVKI